MQDVEDVEKSRKYLKYDEKIAAKIIHHYCFSKDKTIEEICLEFCLDKYSILDWIMSNPEFSMKWNEALRFRARFYAEEIISIADRCDDSRPAGASKAKIQIEARKWMAQALVPDMYGEKQKIMHEFESHADWLKMVKHKIG